MIDSATCSLTDVTIYDCKASGIQSNPKENFKIPILKMNRCRVTHSFSDSVQVMNRGSEIIECSLSENGGSGIVEMGTKTMISEGAKATIVRGCTITKNKKYGIDTSASGDLTTSRKDNIIEANGMGNTHITVEQTRRKQEAKRANDYNSSVDRINNSTAMTVFEAAKVCKEELTESGMDGIFDDDEIMELYAGFRSVKGLSEYSAERAAEELALGLAFQEFRNAIPGLMEESEFWAKRLFDMTDLDGDAHCSFGEYVKMVYFTSKAPFDEKLKFLFDFYDCGDEQITRDYLESLFVEQVEPLEARANELVLEDFFNAVDADGSGEIDWEEFSEALNTQDLSYMEFFGRTVLANEVRALKRSAVVSRAIEVQADGTVSAYM
eukprot:GFYU01009121.1.p1 GENE.GFYU01009121.1~~GFYU01009121.1.p1  ORF type:complete len:427 (-),score=132.03 GFYU01009121.1:94-1236(-)